MCYRLLVTMSATVAKIPCSTGAPRSQHGEHVIAICLVPASERGLLEASVARRRAGRLRGRGGWSVRLVPEID